MGQYGKKVLGEFYASETIQNCKNPTGRIDTLSDILICVTDFNLSGPPNEHNNRLYKDQRFHDVYTGSQMKRLTDIQFF